MSQEYQIIAITGKHEYNINLQAAFVECGFKTNFANQQVGYNFNLNDISTLIVAIIGAGGINAIIASIIQLHKKSIKVKTENGKITDLEIESCMSAEELSKLINEIHKAFKE